MVAQKVIKRINKRIKVKNLKNMRSLPNKITFWLLLILSIKALAQERDPFPIDDSVHTTMSNIEMYYGNVPLDINGKINSKNTLPINEIIVNDITKQPSGLSLTWAISTATALSFKIKPNEAPSPYFLFDMLTKADKNCSLPGTSYMLELENVLKNGSLRLLEYKPLNDCTKKPELSSYSHSSRIYITLYKVAAAKGNVGLPNDEVLANIKRFIDNGKPVIGIMKADDAFRKLKNQSWNANPNNANLFTHTVIVIGYDDTNQEIEVLNCWGTQWGNKGTGRISYRSLYLFKQLYCVIKPTAFKIEKIVKRTPAKAKPRTPKPPIPVPKPKPTILSLQGSISLHVRTNEETFENIKLVHKEGIYELKPPLQWIHKKSFKIQASHLTDESYLYILFVDSDGKTDVLWPHNKKLNNSTDSPIAALALDKKTIINYPRPQKIIADDNSIRWQEQIFVKTGSTIDYLTLLHSSEELEDEEVIKILNEIKAQSISLPYIIRLKNVLGDKLITNLHFEKDNEVLRYKVYSNQGYIVPIVVKID
jgi:hypothetical protein